MTRLLFMCAFLALLYLIATIVVGLVKKRKNLSFNSDLFSRDISTVCKGLAITIIMMSHIANNFGVEYMTPLGSFGVAVFLFFSGYGLEMSSQKNGLKGYWLKRIKTTYLPYLIIEIIGFIFLYKDYTFVEAIFDLLLIDTIHPYGWYMQCVFLYYIAFYVAQLLSKKSNILKYAVLCLSSIAMFVFLGGLFKQQIFSFIFGVMFAANKEKLGDKINKWYLLLISSVLGIGSLAIRQFHFVRESHWVVYNLIYAIQATFLALALISFVHVLCRVLPKQFMFPIVFIGIISNEIYLVHAFCVPKSPSYSTIVLFFAVVFAICSLVYFLKSFFKKIFFARRALGSNVK